MPPTTPSVILGLSFGHGDSSAALIKDGILVAAAEEERFNRVKHYAGFPERAVQYCLSHAGVEASSVNVVAIAKKPLNQFWSKVSLAIRHPQLIRKQSSSKGEGLTGFLNRMGLKNAKVFRTEHHFAHLMSARYLEPENDMAMMSFDGLGDFVSCAIAKASGQEVKILDRVLFPHSLGFFYTAMTQYMGFPHFGDEFKVMGLSSLGEPTYLEPLRELVRTNDKFGFTLNLEAFPILKLPSAFYIEKNQPKVKPLYNGPILTQMLGVPPRKPSDPLTEEHQNLAKSVQIRFEEVANHLLNELHKQVPTSILGLAGGCAHNSVWVGKIHTQTPFKKIMVAPASHDAGIAVGAAIAAAKTTINVEGKHWGLLGPTETELQGSSPLISDLEEKTFASQQKLINWIVERLVEGKILGLSHGRMEFGPRALGSRSIIADPRVADMKDKLNSRVKHRETFRPFAASVLVEHQDQWFRNPFFSPTMEAVFPVKENKMKQIPAVVHVDGTCRIQSVKKDIQRFYWELIEAFRKRTGIPMLLNTSFNDSEPIVCTEKDAIQCFFHCEMDHIIIGERVFTRKQKMKLVG